VATVAPIKLTERDHEILRLIHRHRFLRSHQIITLLGGSAQNLSRRLIAGHAIGRLGKPEEVASAVLWLCSQDAMFMVGHSLLINGGYTAQ